MSKTILLIEEEGYELVTTKDSSRGLGLTRELRPDLVITDIGMPKLDGFEFTRRVKGDPDTRSIPVLVVTVHIFPEEEAEAFAAGCDAFLRKPSSPRQLVDQVRTMIGAPQAVQSPGAAPAGPTIRS
jgi:two-component system, cell cycle response regulator DivK